MKGERWIWCRVQKKPVRPHEVVREPKQRSPLPCPMVITDEIEPFQSMADGKIYTSKSRYYAETRARGYEIVGNERIKPKSAEPDERQIERDLADAYDQCEAGKGVNDLPGKYPEQWKHD